MGKLSMGIWYDFAIDINGPNKPNTYGRDMFFFYYNLNDYKIYPYNSGLAGCSSGDNKQDKICAKWIFDHNNMDYLRE